jgi:hypothetical protein
MSARPNADQPSLDQPFTLFFTSRLTLPEVIPRQCTLYISVLLAVGSKSSVQISSMHCSCAPMNSIYVELNEGLNYLTFIYVPYMLSKVGCTCIGIIQTGCTTNPDAPDTFRVHTCQYIQDFLL